MSRTSTLMRYASAFAVCLCSLNGCDTSGDTPSAFIEDGTQAADKQADEVTGRAREFFATWLSDHGETQIVNDETGVGVEGSPTRLWAFLYGSNGDQNGFSAETEFRVVLPDGREIVEFVAGSGDTEDDAIQMSFANFAMSTFHVVYSCFMNPSDTHMSHENVKIGGSDRVLTTGGIFAMGGEDLPDFAAVSDQIRDELCKMDLPEGTHWLKVVYGRHQHGVIVEAVTLDNEDFDAMTSRLKTLDWPATDNFYLAKQFLVVRPASTVEPSEQA